MDTMISTQNMSVIVTSDPLDRNPAAVYLAKLKKSGRRSMQQSLNMVAAMLSNGNADAFTFPWAELRSQHTSLIRSKLIGTYKPATANHILCAIRGTLKEAWRLELMTSEEYYRARDIQSVTGETLPAGRGLQSGELAALLNTCAVDPTPAGARDAAIIALMYAAGPRREEVINLDLDSYAQETGQLVIFGKRSKERTAYLTNGAAAAMADWLSVRGSEPGALFLAINKGGRIIPGRMKTQAVYNMLAKRAGQASVKKFSPHDLRRSFVSDLLDAGADIATVAKMAGHASVTTTARYDRRGEQSKQKAATLLHIPYMRRTF